MPELPEVETIRQGLHKVLVSQRVERLEMRRPDLRFPLPPDLPQRVSGQVVMDTRRRAKYLQLHLGNDQVLIIHLGMSGRFIIVPPGQTRAAASPAPVKHDHVILHLADGTQMIFHDPRRFGFMDICAQDDLDTHPYFAGLGPEPLSDVLTADFLVDALKGKRTPIKSALLDQRVVAGLGNIYVCEALFLSGISPRRSAHTIGPGRAAKLVPAIKDVLTRAIAAGGSSLRDYVRVDGALGYFQHGFKVYDRVGQPCPNPGCGKPIQRIVQAGRSTFFCSTCQK